MEVREFNEKKKYSEVSGVTAFVEPKIKIGLNDFGLYEELVDAPGNSMLSPLVEKVSPYLNAKDNESVIAKNLYSKLDDINYDKRIGYYDSLYVGHVVEGDYRKNASSGGMGTWIFKALLDKDLIDGVIHVKDNSDKSSKVLYKYEISKSVEEVLAGAKTKYYPVELSEVLEIIKENKGRYAIVGIPSFIKAIRLVCLYDPVINERIVFTVGLICGHQKSSKFAEYMAWQVGIEPGNLKEIDFRHKLADKPADSYAIRMTGYINSKLTTVIKPKSELDGQNWGLGYFKPLASDFTDDVFNETADIVVGDAWLPEYTTDSGGNNIVIVRDKTISRVLLDAIEQNKLSVLPVSVNKIFSSQAAHYRHTHDELVYRSLSQKKKSNWSPQNRVSEFSDISYLRGKVQNLRMDISEQSHMIYKEAVKRNDLNYFYKKMNKLNLRYKLVYYIMAIKNKGIKGLFNKFLKG
ncbi:Coenzyme F420 hydrogenase/dehydrogenase, beta subunit C-terminal domain [Aliivibrio salmonicida]|uniref:Coenzyme F420 hydrogenase/dehydrogenase, beta subunit C-terminal domain n=1 Tax=Aliivibrio salmonicida TaxID=40269 RepID=UPI003D0C01C6